VIDTVLAGLLVAGGVGVIASANKPAPPCTGWCFNGIGDGFKSMYSVGGGLLIAAAIPMAFSAGFGYATTAECRALKEAQLACVSGVEPSCIAPPAPPLPPGGGMLPGN
jgi:hypothetical protein